jgi:hypothetical protein
LCGCLNGVSTIWKERRLINSGAITITGFTGPGGDVTIPNRINGLPVTGIGFEAFSACTNLASVTIPGSVTSNCLGQADSTPQILQRWGRQGVGRMGGTQASRLHETD